MSPSYISPRLIMACIIHSHSKGHDYLLLRRSSEDLPGSWQMITGGIQEDEIVWRGALREIHEESGLIPDRFYSGDMVDTLYMYWLDKVVFVPVFVGFLDSPKAVKLSPKEHDAFAWLPYEKALELLVYPNERQVLTHVHENFVLRPPHPILCIDTSRETSPAQ